VPPDEPRSRKPRRVPAAVCFSVAALIGVGGLGQLLLSIARHDGGEWSSVIYLSLSAVWAGLGVYATTHR
jgi:hypothetical protein